MIAICSVSLFYHFVTLSRMFDEKSMVKKKKFPKGIFTRA